MKRKATEGEEITKEEKKYFYRTTNGKKRELIEQVIGGERVYIDIKRTKRCKCGVRVCWGKTKNNLIIEVHQTANGFVAHAGRCL